MVLPRGSSSTSSATRDSPQPLNLPCTCSSTVLSSPRYPSCFYFSPKRYDITLSCQNSQLSGPAVGMKHSRPRSADLGGLHLATAGSGSGQGWLGSGESLQIRFAGLLTDMYNETLNAVNERDAEFAPTDLPQESRTRLIHSLDSWSFQPLNLPDEEVLACTMMLFEALFRIENMQACLGLSLKDQIYPLIHHLRRIYRWENTYHNFEHALDVLQCCYIFLRSAGMVPSVSILLDEDPDRIWVSQHEFDSGPLVTCLGLKELFVVYIAAIGHDVAHPGFTNRFMQNAETPLSMVYDGKSALEQMHCSLLLRIMRHYGLGPLLDDNGTRSVKKLLSETVLATDMSVHGTFMQNFRTLVDDSKARQGKTETDDPLWRRQVLLCQGIMKCADISNPFRPYHVSQHWAVALMGEWTSQAMLEKYMDLPTTVQCSDDPLSEAKGQVFFINTFAKPLLELMVEALPELQPHLVQCLDNLRLWQSRQNDLLAELKATDPPTTAAAPSPVPSSPSLSTSSSSRLRQDDYLTVFPLALPKHHPYRNISHVDPIRYPSVGSDEEGESDVTGDVPADGVERGRWIKEGTKVDHPEFPRSSASSASLFWPASATGTKETPSPLSNPVAECTARTSISPSSSISISMSSPSSPCASISDLSSVSGDSEYMSVGESLGASSYRSAASPGAGSIHGSKGSVNGKFQVRHEGSPSLSSTSNNGNRNGSSSSNYNSHNSTPIHLLDPHAGLRAAADSAQPMLRKKKSMLNRKSWGAPGEYAYIHANMTGKLENGQIGMGTDSSLSPPPLSSPATFGNELQFKSDPPLADNSSMLSPPYSAMRTPEPVKKSIATILVSQPHPHSRDAQPHSP
ncbi:hypothetical protein BDP27DRAFT_1281431 [Rhodocollybia butyracea]|uniref:Phosphodiesterase n=1 Tax=Rhodocollybia butyracea TaxID=206335 RepID=A0A9P5Q5W1_9AGAR|nr:hypothetical protein BDP27DRAFT_1281431 [Rhodocollybia butyracea]